MDKLKVLLITIIVLISILVVFNLKLNSIAHNLKIGCQNDYGFELSDKCKIRNEELKNNPLTIDKITGSNLNMSQYK